MTTRTGTHTLRVRPPKFEWADPDFAVVQSSIAASQADLLRSLVDHSPAEMHAADNLRAMRLVFAAYDSSVRGQVVRVRE